MPVGIRKRFSIGLVSLCALAGWLLVVSAPALASKPEAPEVTQIVEVNASSAIVRGVLNPNAVVPGEAGTYQLVYRPSTKKECQGAGEAKTPESPGLSMGLEHEETPFEFIGGLTPGTEYAICLIATETGKTEPAVSAAATFKTLTPPVTPETTPATEITGTSATFNGILNPTKPGEEGETYRFYYQQSATECRGAGEKEVPPGFGLPAAGAQSEPVSLNVGGLLPNTVYTYCAVVQNAGFEKAVGGPQTFETTAAAPTIEDEAYTNLHANDVTLTAEIFPGAAATTYQVEYEPGKLTPAQSLPPLKTPVAVKETITGLQPNTKYHAHFIAHNGLGSAVGADDAFTTLKLPIPSALGLPDNRAYELVSTIENVEVFPPAAGEPQSPETEVYGELIANVGGFRAAANGEAVAFIGGLPPSGTGGYGVAKNGNGNLYLSERGAKGWGASDIEPVSNARAIEGFSADLTQQFFNIGEQKFDTEHGGPSTCGASEGGDIYSRTGGLGTAAYQALAPASVSGEECGHLTFAGTSADDAHLLFQSPGAYTQGAIKGEEGDSERGSVGHPAEGFDNLYDSVAGQLHQVNVLPDGAPESFPQAVFGGRSSIGERHFGHDFGNAVSADGARVFWTDLNTGDLYVRENDAQSQSGVEGERCTEPAKACTIQLDLAQQGATGTSGGGQFWTASSDGSKVFFTDCSRLTVNSTADSESGCSREEDVLTGNDLYEYEANPEPGKPGVLRDLTVDGNASDSLGADVQGVIGASKDGSSVSFVANGVLAGANAEGSLPVGGQPNLYVLRDGKTSFIATLAATDNEFIGLDTGEITNPSTTAGDWRAEPGLRTAAVASGGGAVVFMSRLSLTGYGNFGVVSVNEEGKKFYGSQPEVFVYEVGTGRITCLSCTPTDAGPAQTAEGWENTVGGHLGVSGSSTFMLRFINAEGTQVYFDTSQPLVSRDTNDRQDVYEWDSDGSGGCERVGGCVSLLSGGDSPHDAYFLDASESGEDVFFTSGERLLSRALNENVKLYDARVGGGFPESSLACEGTACQGVPPAAPIFATPSSVTFSGVGNFPQSSTAVKKITRKTVKCGKGKKLSHGKCVKRKKQKAKPRKAKRASNDRRAK